MSINRVPTQFYEELMNLHHRRLLSDNPIYHTLTTATPPPPSTNSIDPTEPYNGTNGFDANVVMVLSVLICALVCSLGLNSIIKCAIRCSSFSSATESSTSGSSARLANTGIKKKALKTFAVVNYSPDLKLPGLDTECVICLSEFAIGEKVRLLPKCQHGFHVKCIDKWLNSHSSCPTCRDCLIETCQKIVGCDQASSSQLSQQPQTQPPQQTQTQTQTPQQPQPQTQTPQQPQPQTQTLQFTIVNIPPLEREDLVRCYRSSSQC